jgi:CDP-diacylglycerol--glycerol-3-phosphate 3-phosphatidyltransferase
MGEGIVIAAQKSGKLKTFMQIAGIIFLFTPLRGISLVYFTAGDVVVWLIAAITLISGIEYFKSFGGVLKASK